MGAYERLLGDAMKGDATLFAREDAVEAEWRIVAPILTSTEPAHEYQPGTWGPADADRLIAIRWLAQASAGAREQGVVKPAEAIEQARRFAWE